MRAICLLIAVLTLVAASAVPLVAQLAAFPGAEGAGKFSAGGRGGDVYIVENLNDSGPESLRDGLHSSQPWEPLTIVFAVSGTINLESPLIVNRWNLTIAGQTAPAGGITLYGYDMQVINSRDVILQHLRIRPGDENTAPGVYQPGSLGVTTSKRIMLDHLSTSWSTDEVLSVTHGSEDVTVQWSIVSEALHDSNHDKGPHGFGSSVNGQHVTLHNNLYAHNSSRNPRPGAGGHVDYREMEFINNVIYNPGSRYGYTLNEDLALNLVGNYGIEGPSTNQNRLFLTGGPLNKIYARDNYMDQDSDGILDGGPAPSTAVGGAPYTTLAERAPVPPIDHETTAGVAYQQVLSYAGATAYRDPVDKRVIASVFNQNGSIIDSQTEVGGLPSMPTNTVSLDADGIADWWKTANGFDPDDETVGFQFAADGSGYTNLEKYLHDLNAPYLPRWSNTVNLAISTEYGLGADAQVSENNDLSSGIGDAAALGTSYGGSFGNHNQYTLLRFDLSQIEIGSISEASLELTAFEDLAGHTMRVYGLNPDADDQLWDESTVEFADAPGLTYDADSGTRGLDEEDWIVLGDFATTGALMGDTVALDNLNLGAFLNQLAYSDDEGTTVTLAIEKFFPSSTEVLFASKEATQLESTPSGSVLAGTYAPQLLLTAAVAASSLLAGDYNGDGRVDAADYVVWRDHVDGPAGSFPNDVDGGVIGPAQYATWKANFGAGATSIVSSQRATVPEPASALLLLLAVAGVARRRGSPGFLGG